MALDQLSKVFTWSIKCNDIMELAKIPNRDDARGEKVHVKKEAKRIHSRRQGKVLIRKSFI